MEKQRKATDNLRTPENYGKPFKKLKKDLAADNKREKKTNENI